VISHVVTLLRLTWLPVLITSLAGIYTSVKLAPFVPAIESRNAAEIADAFSNSFGWIALGVLVPLAMNAVVAVAVLRYVIRGDLGAPGMPVHVAFGLPELRVIAVTVLITIALFLISIPLSLLLGLISSATGSPVVAGIGSVAVMLALLITAARWSMAYPVAAVEDRISLDRAWALIRTSYTSFLGFMFTVLLPLVLLDFVMGLLFGPGSADNADVIQQDIVSNWVLLTITGFAVNFFLASVFFTALGVVYRKLTNAAQWAPFKSA
jgi:hypothetical protein